MQVCDVLNRVENASKNDVFPETLEEVERRIDQQHGIVKQLEEHRATIVSLMQKGKGLAKDPNAPEFIQEGIKNLEDVWSDTYGNANDKLKYLKGNFPTRI